MLEGKKVVIGVSGGISAYKTCELVRLLIKRGISVKVVMTESATKLISPITFSALSSNPVYVDTFQMRDEMQHISLARWADAIVIAPATANTIAKIAHGIADNLLTTLVLAAKVPVIIAPAMNVAMWENSITQDNLSIILRRGFILVEPTEGELACKEEGKGRLAEPEDILETILDVLTPKILLDKRVAVTAGPTREHIDPVRFISNPSSGKMGYAIAKVAKRMGAQVTLVSGPVDLDPPAGVEIVNVVSAIEMQKALEGILDKLDVLVMVAAVSDFRPKYFSDKKIPKGGIPNVIEIEENPDILRWVAKKAPNVFRVGFSAETHDLIKNAKRKLKEKGCNLIVANDVSAKGVGFASDKNAIVVFDDFGEVFRTGVIDKEEIAYKIMEEVAKRLAK